MSSDLSVLRARLLAATAAFGAGALPPAATAKTGDTCDVEQVCVTLELGEIRCPAAEEAQERWEGGGSDLDTACTTVFEGEGARSGGVCCYEVVQECADTTPMALGCRCQTGRPLIVRGRPVQGETRPGGGWVDPKAPRPRVEGASVALRERLALHWAAIGLAEYSSIAGFQAVGLDLLACGAPAALIDAAQRAARDELRHARLAFTLATAYAGAPVAPGALPIPSRLPVRRTLPELAFVTGRDGCVIETLSVVLLDAMREHAEDPPVREVVERIGRDERRHAELAWRTASWAVREGGASAREAFLRGVTEARTQLQPDGIGGLEHYGVLSASSVARAYEAGLREVVAPCVRRLAA